MGIRLTGYGRREWIGATVIVAGLCALLAFLAKSVSFIFAPFIAIPVVIWLWVLWFFRDPDRPTPQGEGLFVSPADGHVADITNIGPDSILGCDGVKVGIFMNIFDVHVNRAPAAVRVERTEHMDGAFLDVRDPQASERNESTTIYFTHNHGGTDYPLVVRQIAGLIARRIVTDLQDGQQLQAGQRLGMIKFGSRLELFVPRELAGRVPVEIGQKVLAGLTVLVSAEEEDK